MLNFTDETNAQLLLSVLKGKGVRKAVLCPGSTNIAITRSVQQDPFFEKYSVMDERSAVYVACGMAYESGEPVIVSCTGATSSRNFMSGLTEAFYRKLPIVAIMSMNDRSGIGNLNTQLVDRSSHPNDICRAFLSVPVLNGSDEISEYELKLNSALSELDRDGGGPVCVELITENKGTFSTHELPEVPIIERLDERDEDRWPDIDPEKRVLVYMGAQRKLGGETRDLLERFVETHNAVVFTNVTSGYHGRYSFAAALACQQLVDNPTSDTLLPDLVLHVGEMSGDYDTLAFMGKLRAKVWRVSPDGEFRQSFGSLRKVFQTDIGTFLRHYTDGGLGRVRGEYRERWVRYDASIRARMPELPFTNFWIARCLSERFPESAVVHPSILSSMASWNFFPPKHDLSMMSDVGGFGIDGCLSELVGASLVSPDKLFYSIIGDLSFFYDMNILGNRHIRKNMRVLLINNNVGMTFKYSNHYASRFGDETDEFIAAGRHFAFPTRTAGEPSPAQAWAESLGFRYLRAENKSDFLHNVDEFTSDASDCPVLFECFTDPEDERKAREVLLNLDRTRTVKGALKRFAKESLPDNVLKIVKERMK